MLETRFGPERKKATGKNEKTQAESYGREGREIYIYREREREIERESKHDQPRLVSKNKNINKQVKHLLDTLDGNEAGVRITDRNLHHVIRGAKRIRVASELEREDRQLFEVGTIHLDINLTQQLIDLFSGSRNHGSSTVDNRSASILFRTSTATQRHADFSIESVRGRVPKRDARNIKHPEDVRGGHRVEVNIITKMEVRVRSAQNELRAFLARVLSEVQAEHIAFQ